MSLKVANEVQAFLQDSNNMILRNAKDKRSKCIPCYYDERPVQMNFIFQEKFSMYWFLNTSRRYCPFIIVLRKLNPWNIAQKNNWRHQSFLFDFQIDFCWNWISGRHVPIFLMFHWRLELTINNFDKNKTNRNVYR